MDYTEMLTDNRFSVIAALPRNDLALAEAALEGGAQAVKVHCNVGTAPAETRLAPLQKTGLFCVS